MGSLRPLLGVRPWTASDFALGATLIAPLESAMPFGVLSLATVTNGLPIPDITSSLSDSVLFFGVLLGYFLTNNLSWLHGIMSQSNVEPSRAYGRVVCFRNFSKWICTNYVEDSVQTALRVVVLF